MQINYTAWRFWFDVGQMVATIAIGGYVWWTNREKVTSGKFAKLEKAVSERATKQELGTSQSLNGDNLDELEKELKGRLDRHRREMVDIQNRLIKVESDVCHLPSQQDMRTLGTEIGGLRITMGELAGKLSGINRAVDLINEGLIQEGLRGKA